MTASERLAAGHHVTGSAVSRLQSDNHPTRFLDLERFVDIEPSLDTQDFVENLLTAGAMSVIYGESNCGKSFFALDLALHVAAGKPWRGREVDGGGVIYLALEGSHGIRNRVAAYRMHNNIAGPLPFSLAVCRVNLLAPSPDITRVIDTVRKEASDIGIPIRLVIVDTLSRAMAGGNENAPEDMTAFVQAGDRIREETGAHTGYIHHTGKDTARGSRGHSSLRAAIDTEIEVSHDEATGIRLARVTKQRDLDPSGEFAFALESVELGRNRRGKLVTSCVVVPADAPAGGRVRLSDDQRTALDLLVTVIGRDGQTGNKGVPVDRQSVFVPAWRREFLEKAKPGAEHEAKKKAFNRAVDKLISVGKVMASGDYVWLV